MRGNISGAIILRAQVSWGFLGGDSGGSLLAAEETTVRAQSTTPAATVSERFKDRRFYQHNPTATLMRTTIEENRKPQPERLYSRGFEQRTVPWN